jgi:hypothetical protein
LFARAPKKDNSIPHEATMFEWMPVLSGAVLGLLQLRGHIAQRTLLCLGILCACIATASSGELFAAPQLILVDLALVAGGVFVVRTIASAPMITRDTSRLPSPTPLPSPQRRDDSSTPSTP